MGKIFRLEHLRDFVFVAGKDGQECVLSLLQFIVRSNRSIEFLFFRLSVHRNVIEASCTKFGAMTARNLLQRKIIVPEANGNLLRTTVDFIYSGHIHLTFSNVYDIAYIAYELGIDALEQKCAHFLNANLSLENCVKILTIATTCDHFQLFKKSWKFLCERFAHLPPSNVTLLFLHAQRTEIKSHIASDQDNISSHVSKCFELMESKHSELIPNVLKSICLKTVPSKVN